MQLILLNIPTRAYKKKKKKKKKKILGSLGGAHKYVWLASF